MQSENSLYIYIYDVGFKKIKNILANSQELETTANTVQLWFNDTLSFLYLCCRYLKYKTWNHTEHLILLSAPTAL